MTADPFHTGLHPGGYSQPDQGDFGKRFIAAASGGPINLLDPEPDSITLADVARGLSMTCRFAGQVDRFYSIAEHSAFVLDLTCAVIYPTNDWELEGWALLHDAQEAFIHDLTGPLKHALQLAGDSAYAELEARWTEAIRVRFNLPVPSYLTVRAIKRWDHYAARLEGGRIKYADPFYRQYADESPPAGVHCAFGLDPGCAERLFLARCESLGIR